MAEFKSFSSTSISHSATPDKVDFRVLQEMLETLLNRCFREYDENNTQLLAILNDIDEDVFFGIWNEFCDLIFSD